MTDYWNKFLTTAIRITQRRWYVKDNFLVICASCCGELPDISWLQTENVQARAKPWANLFP
jgi:hypothetical protein